jgi:hypothetical protein
MNKPAPRSDPRPRRTRAKDKPGAPAATPLPEPDLSESVAGEEDPGASMDVSLDTPAASPTPPKDKPPA